LAIGTFPKFKPVFTKCWHNNCNILSNPNIALPVKTVRRTSKHQLNPAFTLVELLVVIAIIGILALAVATMVGTSGPQARKASVDTLTGLIEQARTTAITSRTHVLLAIAEPTDLPGGDGRCRVGLFKVPEWPNDGPDPSSLNAILLGRWTSLNNGIVLVGGTVDGIPNPFDSPKITIRYGPANRPMEVQVHAMAFHSRGGLHLPSGSEPISLRIAEGGYRNGVASPNRRADTDALAESRIKIGRIVGRPYRTD